jgi:perosamine synthetase
MTDLLPSHRITFTEDQIESILKETRDILESGQVILGDRTRRFEEAYAEACGRKYGVAVGSDTAAFEMQLKTLAVSGRHVLYPALAFPSILEAVKNAGAEPWFFDGDWDGHLFARLPKVQEAVWECQDETGEKPIALILMHTGGLIARDSAEITAWCETNGIAVLEDAAHSFGAVLQGKPAGSFGLSSAFSLYATKPMHACEGGMIVTDDADIVAESKIYRNYGRTQDFGRSVIVRHGYSWRLTEIQAAIGLANLQGIDASIKRRREIMAMYDELCVGGPWGDLFRLELDPSMEPNGYRYILMMPEGKDHADRMRLRQAVRARGIDLPGEVYELPSHKQPIWQEYQGLKMPMSEQFCDRHFSLPVYQSLTDDDVSSVVARVGEALVEAL